MHLLQTPWAGLLRWPPLPPPPDKALGISVLELAVHFTVWAKRMPTIAVAVRAGVTHYCSDWESLQLLHIGADDLAGSFQAALETGKKKLGRPLVPASRAVEMVHLRSLGLTQVQAGFLVCPEWP